LTQHASQTNISLERKEDEIYILSKFYIVVLLKQ
jgi:hypothetical protein